MGDLSEHFDRNEFECKCGCGLDTVDAELVAILEDVRVFFGEMVQVTSGNRCDAYNENIGGSRNSQHTKSRGGDVIVQHVEPAVVQEYLLDKYPFDYGIGRYDTFTHVDSRMVRARWDYRNEQ